jgi:ABC-type branched-subunit amino acid transport system substrate-binding protein
MGGGDLSVVLTSFESAVQYAQMATWALGAESAGFTVLDTIYVPFTTTDFSSIGIKAAQMDPDVLSLGVAPAQDALILRDAIQAGFKGIPNCPAQLTTYILSTFATTEEIEGYVGGAWPCEFDPCLTDVAQEFKDAWIEYFGSWESPEIKNESAYEVMRAALLQSGSLDPDVLADTIASGMQFEGPQGKGQMVPRNDLGNDRTVACVFEYWARKLRTARMSWSTSCLSRTLLRSLTPCSTSNRITACIV